MSKTYSVAILKDNPEHGPTWITNWGQYASLDDIDWDLVYETVMSNRGYLAYGYYYGHNSRNLTSDKCRTEVFRAS